MRRLVPALVLVIGFLALVPAARASEQLNYIALAYGSASNQYMAAYLNSSNDLECRVIGANGIPSGSAVLVSSDLCYNPAIAYDSDLDRFLVVWAEYAADKYTVQARIVSPSGVLADSEIPIESDLSWKPGGRVAYSPNSQRYLVVFTDASAIEAQYVNGNGTLYGLVFDALPGDSHEGFSYADNPAIAYDSVNHHFLVTGLLFGNGSPPMSLYGAMVDDVPEIAMYKAPFAILDSATFLYPPAIAFDSANEHFLVIWELYLGYGHDLRGQLINADGTLEGTELTIVEDSVAFATDVAYRSGNGRFLVAWLDERSGLAIYAQEVNANGTNYDSDFLLASPAYQYNLALAYNPQADNTLMAYSNAGGNASNGFVVTPAVSTADLSVEITGPDRVLLGTNLTYTLSVSNAGDASAPGVTVTDTLPVTATFVSAVASQGSCDYAAGVVTCNLGALADGASATVTIVVTPTALGEITNTATVTSGALDPDEDDNTAAKQTTVLAYFPVSPSMGTTGTQIEIRGEGFGRARGKAYLARAGKSYPLTIRSWNLFGSGVIHAVLKKAPPAGTYDVVVQPEKPKRAEAITETAAFEVMAPEITSWEIVRPGFIAIQGNYFGTDKGQVTLGDVGEKPVKCKERTWVMNPVTGASLVEVSYKALPPGGYFLWLTNSVGTTYLD